MTSRDKALKDNRGMTLLEVIIAVAIFSIAAIILMQGFVTSGRINKKSNLYLEATSTAQNVMEELKAKDFEDIALAFNFPLDSTFQNGKCRFYFLEGQADRINNEGGITIQEKIDDGKGNLVNVKTIENGGKEGDPFSATALSEDGGKTYTFNPRKKGDFASKYFFEMLNVANKKETFDVLVKLDGSKSSKYKKEDNATIDEKNDYESPNIAKLDNKTNAFLIMNDNWINGILDEMIKNQKDEADKLWEAEKQKWDDEHPVDTSEDGVVGEREEFPIPEPEVLDRNELYKNLKKTWIVTLSDNNDHITLRAKCKINAYNYAIPGSPYANFRMCPCKGRGNEQKIEGCFCTQTSVETTFYASEVNVKLKNIYLFYYPNYLSTDRLDTLDNIEFINEINYPVSLYVVKQKTEDITNMTDLSLKERGYRMRLSIQEDPANDIDKNNANWFTNLNLFQAKTNLKTNLNWDISKDKVTERQSVNQMLLVYKDKEGKTVSDAAAEKVLSYSGLDDRKQKDRIYKVTVGVYKAGAAQNGYPDEDLIVSLDGSKED